MQTYNKICSPAGFLSLKSFGQEELQQEAAETNGREKTPMRISHQIPIKTGEKSHLPLGRCLGNLKMEARMDHYD